MIVPDYLPQAALSVAVYAVIFAGWWRCLPCRLSSPTGGLSVQLLLAATCLWAQIYCVALVLGLFTLLNRSSVLALNSVITGLLLAFSYWRPKRRGSLAALLRDRLLRGLPRIRRDPLLLVALGICGTALAWFCILNIAFPSGGYDDFVFHLPAAAYFLQQHSFGLIPVTPAQEGINNAAKLGEMFSIFQFSLFGDDGLVHFWSFLFLLHYLMAVYVLCRQLGASARSAMFGAIFSAFAPTLLCQVLTAYNDLPVAALFATALSFSFNRERGFWQNVATGISCGLLLASKHSAGLLCGIAIACSAHMDWKSRRGYRFVLKSGLTIVVVALTLGAFWPIRNLREYGNPFFPYEAKLAGVGFSGPRSTVQEMEILNRELTHLPLPVRLWRLWREEKSHFGLWLYNYDSAYAGFGPLFFILGLPTLVAGAAISAWDRDWNRVLVLLLGTAAYLGFAGNISPRLSLFILPVTGVAFAIMLGSAHRMGPGRGALGFPAVLQVAGIVLAGYTFLVASVSPVPSDALHAQLYANPSRKDLIGSTFLNAFSSIRLAIPSRASVAYDESTSFVWPLWRSDWNNEVHFVSSTSGWARWASQAAALGITHVVSGKPATSPLAAWIEERPHMFERIATCSFGSIYAFKP